MRELLISGLIKVFELGTRATLPFIRLSNPKRAQLTEQCLRQMAWARSEQKRIIRLLDTDTKAGLEELQKFGEHAERKFGTKLER